MALNFYLNQIDNEHKIKVQCNASFTSKVGDFDVGTLELEWNKTKNKVVPFTKLFIVDNTNNDTWCFVILNDDVEIVKKTPPVLYIHNLTVIQNTYEMTSHLVRNSVFSQPFAPKVAKLQAIGSTAVEVEGIGGGYRQNQKEQVYLARDDDLGISGEYVYTYERLYINPKEKVKNAYIDMDTLTNACKGVVVDSGDFYIYKERKWLVNKYKSVRFVIRRYETKTSTSALDGFTKTVFDGAKYNFIDNLSFFIPGYWYELQITTDVLPKIQQLDEFDIEELSEGWTVPDGEKWLFPSIQTVFHCALVVETYYYSLYDVLNTLKEQTRKVYNGVAVKPDLYTIDNDDALTNTVAPEFTFSGQDLWTCNADVLSYIDAIPLLDENNELTFEYLNDYSRTSLDLKMVDEKSSLNDKYYTNSLVANYQNGRQDNAIYYPGRNLYRRVASKVYGVPGSDDYEMQTDKPIDYLDGVYFDLFLATRDDGYDFNLYYDVDASLYQGITSVIYEGNFPNHVLDVTDAVFEQSIYSLLPMADEDSLTQNQLNTLYYVKGSKSIYLGGIRETSSSTKYEVYLKVAIWSMRHYFGIEKTTNGRAKILLGRNIIPSVYNLGYCVKYHAVYDGRVSQESPINKHFGETYVSQEQGGVNLNRMGNNMQGLVAKLGNEVENVAIPVTDYGSRIKKGSLWVDDDGKKYIANTVKTTFSTKSQKVMVEANFSRNFNLLSQYTKIDQEKRFYEISDKLVDKGYENIVEFLYFSYTQAINDDSALALTDTMLREILHHEFLIDTDNNVSKADFAIIQSYLTGNEILTPNELYLPLHCYGLGNSLCFEMGFEDAINAGDHIVDRVIPGVIIATGLLSRTCLYVDESGFANAFDIKVCSLLDDHKLNGDLPNMRPFLNDVNYDTLIDISKFYYYKKPNEIFHLNYSIAFMSYPNEEIFFGDSLINKNNVIRGFEGLNPYKNFYLYVGDELYSIIDNKVLSTHTNMGLVTTTYTKDPDHKKGSLTFELVDGSITSANAWAIADSEGNVYFAANQKLKNATSVTLYFAARRTRFSD